MTNKLKIKVHENSESADRTGFTTKPVPAQTHQIQKALDNLEKVLKEQGMQMVIDRENGVFRLIPVTYYLDDMDSHDLDADPSHDESEFVVIDPPIAIYDNYYHGIFDK